MKSDIAEEQFWTARRFGLFLLTLLIVLFPGPILLGKSFILRDFGIFGYPLAMHHREAFWSGEIPLWNPLNSCGLPFLAQWNTLVLYPLSAIYLLLPLPMSVTIFCLAHFWWAGFGAYCFCSRWTGNRLAGVLGGLAFIFNGLVLNCLMWPNNMAAISWLPWLLLTTGFARERGGRWIGVAAIVGGCQMLAGAPEIILFSWIFVVLFWVFGREGEVSSDPKLRWAHAEIRPPSDGALRRTSPLLKMPRLGCIIFLVGALAAAQLLPFLDLLLHSQRHAKFGVESWSMPPWGWLNFLEPLFRTYRSGAGVFFQKGQDWTSSYYSGVVILLLGTLAIRKKHLWLWSAALSGMILSLGERGILYSWLLKCFPFLGFMRFPIKFVVLPVVAFPLLAAVGVAEALRTASVASVSKRLKIAGGVLGLGIAAICAVSVFVPYPMELSAAVLKNAAVRLLFLAGGAVAFWKIIEASTARARNIFGILLVAIVALDGWTHAPRMAPSVASGVLTSNLITNQFSVVPRYGEVRAFTTASTHDHFYSKMMPDLANDFLLRRVALMGNCNLLDRIPTADGFYSMYLPAQRDVWEYLFWNSTNQSSRGIADFLGIGQISTSTNLVGWESRNGAMPLATIGQKPAFLSEPAVAAFLYSTNFDPRTTVVLPESAGPGSSEKNPALASIVRSTISSQRLEFDVEADSETFMVCAQSYFHWWTARVDGVRTPILPANSAFQAVRIPGGKHTVVFTYEDQSFRIGICISLAALFAVGILICRGKPGWGMRGRIST